MGTANTESYEEMVEALNTLKSEVGEHCGNLSEAASRCSEQASEDPVATKASDTIKDIVDKIQEQLDTVDEVIDYLNDEIERIQEIAKQGENAMG